VSSRLRAKRLLGALARGRRQERRRVVLLYHAIGDSPFAVSVAAFRAQMEWLAGTARFAAAKDVAASEETAPLSVAISFDDGYESVFREALPVLREMNAAGTVFLTTACMGEAERRASDPALGHYPDEHFLLWREAEALAEAGWTIGSHGIDHIDFTAAPPFESTRQLRASKTLLEEHFQTRCDTFAYTWGRHTPALREEVRKAGYRYGFAGTHGAVSERSNPFAIPRIDIPRQYTLEDFGAVVLGDWDYLGWVQKARARFS